jgi:hypothetical protein
MTVERQDHLERIREDVRHEIKSRIEQRDKYSIQLTIALAAIIAVAFSQAGFRRVLLAAPLVSIYFTVLILYSYRVHGILAQYLREVLEPRLAEEFGVDLGLEWENFYARNAVPGIRRTFFITSLWVITVLSLAILFAAEWRGADMTFRAVLLAASLIYLVASGLITMGLGSPS